MNAFPGYHEVGVIEGGVVEDRTVLCDLVVLGTLMRGDTRSQVYLKGFDRENTSSMPNAAPDGTPCDKL